MAGCLALLVVIAEDVLDGGGFISRDEAVLGWFVEHERLGGSALASTADDDT